MFIVDFETGPISGPVSHTPPEPVGVAILEEGSRPYYIGWGHPTGNNGTLEEAMRVLLRIWHSNARVCFHNAPFDLAVAEKHLSLPWLQSWRIEDTLLLAYLYDSQMPSLSLKPLAQTLLGMPPEEQDEVRHWLIEHGIVIERDKNWGAHIGKAPGNIVGPYAIGDVVRTRKLHDFLYKKVQAEDMVAAYDRELRLMEVLHRNTQQGIRVDQAGIAEEISRLSQSLELVDQSIRCEVSAPGLNLDANRDLADALDRAGKVKAWGYTAKGERSTAREALLHGLNDPMLAHQLAYRGQVATLLNTFLGPWLVASGADGRLHPNWNQVRGESGGTRTGRLSCSEPNLQNVPSIEKMVQPPAGCPPLPNLRRFFLPEPGCVYVSADFHSQEIRILGHYADGAIAEIYNRDPSADVHGAVIELVKRRTGKVVGRKEVKIVVFSMIYGAGARSIAARLGISEAEGYELVNAILDSITGVRSFRDEIQAVAHNNEGIRTWGGRRIYSPPGRTYALLNYLIQGSAADQTKQALVDYDKIKESGTFLLTVHDEICISAYDDDSDDWIAVNSEVRLLKHAMEKGKFDVPMRATVSVGSNWGEMKPWRGQ